MRSLMQGKRLLALLVVVGALIFLGRLLRPGYLLTLDMAFVPAVSHVLFLKGSFINSYPMKLLVYVLSQIFQGWVVQKLLLLSLFCCIPALAHRFLLPAKTLPSVRFWASVFYLVNPFVYTRFLAGQWYHLFAYAFLPWILHQSLVVAGLREPAVKRKKEWVDPVLLGVGLALTFVFSLHIGVMAFLLSVLILVSTVTKKDVVTWVSKSAVVYLTLIAGTLYWVIPYFMHQSGGILAQFDQRHWEAYRTTSDATLGTVGNVLALYGFWGEGRPWAGQFIWPQHHPWLFGMTGLALVALIVFGIVTVLRRKEDKERKIAQLLLGVLVVATIFSSGLGEGVFHDFNLWLFEYVGFWRGFRDTQKWSALIVLVYAYFGGRGVMALLELSTWKRWMRFVAVGLSFVVVLGYTWPMLGGFWGQLRPVWYPGSWHQANAIVEQDANCKALFLPWHQYVTFGFTNRILVANPARDFFHCEVITSRRVELEAVETQSVPDPAYDAIDGIVTGRDGWSPDQAADILQEAGVTYILQSHDLIGEDPFEYGFLHTSSFSAQEIGKDFTLYQLVSSTSTP